MTRDPLIDLIASTLSDAAKLIFIAGTVIVWAVLLIGIGG